jgi:hypothetical protein
VLVINATNINKTKQSHLNHHFPEHRIYHDIIWKSRSWHETDTKMYFILPSLIKVNSQASSICRPFVWQFLSEDTKEVIRIRKSKNNRQHNDQKKKVQKDKQRSPKHTCKTKDRETRTSLKTGVLRKGISSCSTRSSDIWPLHCPFFFHLRILITPLVSSDIWPLCCLFFDLRILITPLVSSDIWPLCCLIFFDNSYWHC